MESDYRSAGRAKDEPIPNQGGNHKSPLKSALLDFLRQNPKGATMAQIIENVSAHPDVDLSGRYGKATVYNLVARLVGREILARDHDIVRLSANPNGAAPDEQRAPELALH
jgi:hypothetical protein